MQIKCLGMCRGDGKGYARISLVNISFDEVGVRAIRDDGAIVPSLWVRGESLEAEGTGVVVFPLLGVSTITLELFRSFGSLDESTASAAPIASFYVRPSGLKWRSRLTYRLRPHLCSLMRGIDEHNNRNIGVSLVLCMPDGEESVWRVAAESPALDVDLAFSAWDGEGNQLSSPAIFFENQPKIEDSNGGFCCRRVMSFRVPRSANGLFVFVEDRLGKVAPGMLGFDKESFHGELSHALHRVRTAADERDFRQWLLDQSEGCSVHRRDHEPFTYKPLVSIVVPCYRANVHYLKDMLESVLAQSYDVWELVLVDSECGSSKVAPIVESYADSRIKAIPLQDNQGIVGNTNVGIVHARGDYVAFLDYDDVLDPCALESYVRYINEYPEAGALYCDEDSFEVMGEFRNPIFKSGFNLDLLYAHNCITHWLMVKKVVLDEIGLSDAAVNGAQDYDLALRVFETDREIVHVPHILYHWRLHPGSTAGDNLDSKPYAHEAGRVALCRHFKKRGIPVSVGDGDGPFVYRVRYVLPNPQPFVDILIPSKDHTDILDRCVSSILEKSTYGSYRITVIENNSTDKETFVYYEKLVERDSRIRVITWPEEFNYSKIMNFGAAHSNADLLLLLNNDTEVISPDFIEEMAGYLQRPEVGVVGAKLFYYDGLVQHAGMLIGVHDTVAHVNQNVPDSWGAYLGRAIRPNNFSGVTGACQMVRRAVFEEVGGYSEEFAVGFNDIDFCCKVINAGYRVTFTPYAKLYHNEFVSRGREDGDNLKMVRWHRERDLMIKKWPRYFDQGDPFSNPNLDRNSIYYALS